MDLEWSEGHLERFYNLRENYSEHFDEERAKEIAKWLKEHQEEVYLDKLLEEGLLMKKLGELPVIPTTQVFPLKNSQKHN